MADDPTKKPRQKVSGTSVDREPAAGTPPSTADSSSVPTGAEGSFIVSESRGSGSLPEPGSLLALIHGAGFEASPDVSQLQVYAATVQQHRFDIGASSERETTRSTALWSAMHLIPEIGTSLEQAGIDQGDLAAKLSLKTDMFNTQPTTTRCHDDFANAIAAYLPQRSATGPVVVAEVILAILLSSRDRSTGLLPTRIGDLTDAIAAMESLAGISVSVPTFDPEEFSGSVREVRRQLADVKLVTAGGIASALQAGDAHAGYAQGRFPRAQLRDAGRRQAPFDEWALEIRGLYDIEHIQAGPQKVIDGRMFLLGLADLDDAFAARLEQNGVRAALSSEVPVQTLRQASPGDLEGGVSTEYVDPTKGIKLEYDRMGVAPYASMLATVICDKDTKMPLSFGIFGEWGSGKSYFMGLLRGRIDVVRTSNPT